MHPASRFALMSTVLALAVGTAHATNGVIEINHARALAGGVTAGDTPGYPVTISQPGSYLLTGDLLQPNPNTDVISIAAAGKHVSIDLNGFAILGSTTCVANVPTTCSGTGTGTGITAPVDSVKQVSVANGTISGMGGDGMRLRGSGNGLAGYLARVTGVTVSECGGNGINVSGRIFLITDVVAQMNGGNGIHATDGYFGEGGIISRSVATYNGAVGILADYSGANLLESNVAIGNALHGLLGATGRSRNVAFGNKPGSVPQQETDQIGGGASLPPDSNYCGFDPC